MEPNVRCGAIAAGPLPVTCQLYVGHDGDHAALIMNDTGRVLRRWSDDHSFVDSAFVATTAAGLAWAPGHPSAEAMPTPNLTVVATNPNVLPSAKTGRLHIA